MTGEADVPTGDPVGTGEVDLRLRRGQGQVCYRLEVQNITLPSVGAHIHRGGGRRVRADRRPAPSARRQRPVERLRDRLTRARLKTPREPRPVLRHVYTTDFPGGAVRGQLTGTTDEPRPDAITVTLNGTSERNAAGTCNLGDADRAGTTVFRFRPGTSATASACSTSGSPRWGRTSISIRAPAADPIIGRMRRRDASRVSSGLHGDHADADRRDLATPANFYNNVHTTDFPAGAIRGASAESDGAVRPPHPHPSDRKPNRARSGSSGPITNCRIDPSCNTKEANKLFIIKT